MTGSWVVLFREGLLPFLTCEADVAWPALRTLIGWDIQRIFANLGKKPPSFPYVSRWKKLFPFCVFGVTSLKMVHFLFLPQWGTSHSIPKPTASPGTHRHPRWSGHLRKGCRKVPGNQRNMSRDKEPGRSVSWVCVTRFHLFNLEVPIFCLIESQRMCLYVEH